MIRFVPMKPKTVGATTLLELVTQGPVGVQVDTLHGVSQSLRIIGVDKHGLYSGDPLPYGAQRFPSHGFFRSETCRERPCFVLRGHVGVFDIV